MAREPSAPRLDHPDERLKWARRRAGFEEATDAARKFQWNENTYRSHENGNRGISKRAAAIYAKAFTVPVGWLLYNEGDVTGDLYPELRTMWESLTPEDQRRAFSIIRAMAEAA